MTEWRCLVVSREGANAWRVVDAPTERGAVVQLLADGLTPLEVRSGSVSLMERLSQPVRIGRTLGIGDQALIMTQLATLIRAGLPIDRSLDLLFEQAPRAGQREGLARVVAHVRSGGSLASGFDQLESFPAYVIGVLRSSERSGQLASAVASLAQRLALAASTRRQLITALTYPAAVLTATILAVVLVLTIVVPQFEPIFEGHEDKLPTVTTLVLNLSSAVTNHGLSLICALFGLPVALWLLLRSNLGIAMMTRYRSRIPGLAMRDQYIAGQFIGIFSTLVSNGVSAVNALPLARDAVGSRRWRKSIDEVERAVRAGSRLSSAISRYTFVPNAATRLIEIGEHSGQLAETCRQASTIISENVRARIDRIVSLVNPIAIILLGGLVGLLVAGVMLGIFAIGDFAG